MPPISRRDLDHVLAHAGADLSSLQGARVLVTGATGFVGSWLVESAVHANALVGTRLRVIAAVPPGCDVARDAPHLAALQGVEFVRGDVRNWTPAEVASQLGGAIDVDAVIHAATMVDAATIATNPRPTLDSAVDGTRRTLDIARAGRARRFLFLSSGAVYGRQPAGLERMAESFTGSPDPMDPGSVYAEGKRIGETMCAVAHRAEGIETVVARAFAFLGPHLPLDRHFAVGNFMRDAMAGGPIVVRGDGTAVRSYMHAADMTAWLWALLARGEAGRAYNVGAATPVTIAELARRVSRAAVPQVAVEVRGTPVAGAAPDRYVPDVSFAAASLGLRETIGLDEAIERTMRWHREGA
jgi:nucleoside-diphosphate-sugar epimerase